MHRKRRVFFHPLRRQEMKLLGGIIQTACLAVWRTNCWLSSSPYADAQKNLAMRGFCYWWCPGAESNHRHGDFQMTCSLILQLIQSVIIVKSDCA